MISTTTRDRRRAEGMRFAYYQNGRVFRVTRLTRRGDLDGTPASL